MELLDDESSLKAAAEASAEVAAEEAAESEREEAWQMAEEEATEAAEEATEAAGEEVAEAGGEVVLPSYIGRISEVMFLPLGAPVDSNDGVSLKVVTKDGGEGVRVKTADGKPLVITLDSWQHLRQNIDVMFDKFVDRNRQ